MKTAYNILAVALVWVGCSTHLMAQVSVEFAEDYNPTSEVNDQILKSAISKALADYEKYATLANPDSKALDEESKKGFYGLFQHIRETPILKDFTKKISDTDLITPRDYVESYLETGMLGLEFELTSAEIIRVTMRESGDMDAVVAVEKKFYQLYNEANFSIEDTGEPRQLLFKYTIYEELGETQAIIYGIEYNGKTVEMEAPQRYISIYVGIGSAVWSPALSSYWNSTHQQSGFKVSGGSTIYGGLEYMSNKWFASKETGKRRIAPLIGLRYSYTRFTTEIDDLRLSDFDAIADNGNGATRQYRRHVMVKKGNEDITLATIDVPIGVGLRLNKADINNHSRYFLLIKAVPTFAISSNAEITAVGNYDGTLYGDDHNLSEFRLLNQNAIKGGTGENSNWRNYDVGYDKAIIQGAEPQLTTVGLKLELSPTMYFDMNEKSLGWELMIGLDLGYQLISNFARANVNSVDDESFRFSDQYSESLLNQYTDNLNGFTFGLRIGFHRRTVIY